MSKSQNKLKSRITCVIKARARPLKFLISALNYFATYMQWETFLIKGSGLARDTKLFTKVKHERKRHNRPQRGNTILSETQDLACDLQIFHHLLL